MSAYLYSPSMVSQCKGAHRIMMKYLLKAALWLVALFLALLMMDIIYHRSSTPRRKRTPRVFWKEFISHHAWDEDKDNIGQRSPVIPFPHDRSARAANTHKTPQNKQDPMT